MRSKEEAHDYRYFPEPDLPPLDVSPARIDGIRAALPELAPARRARFVAQYALPEYDAVELTRSREAADFFEATVAAGAPAKPASNWIMGEVARTLHAAGATIGQSRVSPDALAGLIALVEQGTVSSTIAKDVFEKMWSSGRQASAIVEAEGLAQINDTGALAAAVADVIAAQPDTVAQYRAGQTKVLGFLVGQVMKATGGKASPKVVNELLRQALDQAHA